MASSSFLTILNLAISTLVVIGCACRLRELPKPPAAILSRLIYVLILTAAFCNGFRGPLFGTVVPNWWPIIGGTSILLLIVERFVSRRGW